MTDAEEGELNSIAMSVFGKQLISLNDAEMTRTLEIRQQELNDHALLYCGSSRRYCRIWHHSEHLGRSREEYWREREAERVAEQEARNNQHVISVTITVVT